MIGTRAGNTRGSSANLLQLTAWPAWESQSPPEDLKLIRITVLTGRGGDRRLPGQVESRGGRAGTACGRAAPPRQHVTRSQREPSLATAGNRSVDEIPPRPRVAP
eukprot:6390113-Pyramimonas_sp.AAC.1